MSTTASQQIIIVAMRHLCKRNYFNGNSLHLHSIINVKHRLLHSCGANAINIMIKVYCNEIQIEFNS